MPLRILLGSPVRQKEAILTQFLESLNQLDTSGLELDFVFVDDHNEHDLLTQYAAERLNVRIFPGNPEDSYIRDETTHYWRDSLIWKIAAYKDNFIKLALEEDYDYLFLVDSDLYLQPPTLKHLISLQKEIVAEVFWTKWQPNTIPLPQVWMSGHYNMYAARRGETLTQEEINRLTGEFLQMLSCPGTYKVGMLGACTLISKKALEMGVAFRQIYNLDLWGEDRHFCVRAAALNLELYADTHYSPYHIYRDSELDGLKDYKIKIGVITNSDTANLPVIDLKDKDIKDLDEEDSSNSAKIRDLTPSKVSDNHPQTSTLTLAMLVRNEAGKYLEKVLKHALQYVDRAVILDDASEDNTVKICKDILNGIPLTLVSNPEAGFNNEIELRKQLWEMTMSEPDWIIVLDADEIFEDKAIDVLKKIAKNQSVYHYSFRLYDMWNETSYREDTYWNAHTIYRPFMVKNVPGYNWVWRESPLHCGRLPQNIWELPGELSSLRLKHLGWMKEEDRLDKYWRYKRLDPNAVYGIPAQYESILDPNPILIPWED